MNTPIIRATSVIAGQPAWLVKLAAGLVVGVIVTLIAGVIV